MAYGSTMNALLAELQTKSPEMIEILARDKRRIERGLLSVGLKVHCLDNGWRFRELIDKLGGRSKVVEQQGYKRLEADFCLVLPPVGSAKSAICLLESIGAYVGTPLLGNGDVHIQVCSPGRLDARRAAILAIGFYLGSDVIRRFDLDDFATTVSADGYYKRGQRLVIYDACGNFDPKFKWWKRKRGKLKINSSLPFGGGRTDIHIGNGSAIDIENVNMIATLLVHAQFNGFWKGLGERFERDFAELLERHMLLALVEAPWVHGDQSGSGRWSDWKFESALQELMAYVFEETVRVRKPSYLFKVWKTIPARESQGILEEVQYLLGKYRARMVRMAMAAGKGESP